MGLVSSKKARQILGVSGNTLRAWADAGKVRCVRVGSGYRRYDLTGVMPDAKRRRVCYCRVSSSKQRDDLERRCAFMQEKFPDHEIVKDIGSGLGFRRPGLNALLESAVRGDVEEIVVAHRDRLARFGSELFDSILQVHGGRLLVLDQTSLSPEAELTRDLLNIIHVFSCRLHGLRKYSRKVKEDRSFPHGTTA